MGAVGATPGFFSFGARGRVLRAVFLLVRVGSGVRHCLFLIRKVLLTPKELLTMGGKLCKKRSLGWRVVAAAVPCRISSNLEVKFDNVYCLVGQSR